MYSDGECCLSIAHIEDLFRIKAQECPVEPVDNHCDQYKAGLIWFSPVTLGQVRIINKDWGLRHEGDKAISHKIR